MSIQQYEPDVYYHISPFAKNWIATSGVMNFCERNQCFWVLDTLASYVPELARTQGVDYFLIVTVDVNPDQTAVFSIKQESRDKDGDSYRVLVRQEIEYTDLTQRLTFWAINESAGDYNPACRTVVLLPEEY
jgi:hypothetical protein